MNWLQREINKSSVLIVYDSLSVLLYSFWRDKVFNCVPFLQQV